MAFAGALAVGGFFLPQEVPLEWYPLNEPGEDILYLELTCASDKDGDVKVYYNATRGINELHTIYFPISPTEQTFTYTFPLLDAPIVELRLDPVADGGTLTVSRMRILDRRGDEVRRFTRDMFVPVQQVASVIPADDGWKITSVPGSNDPFLRVELPSPILAKDRDYRNFLRCVLSTSYLAGMLFILLLAVFFAFTRPQSWRELPAPLAYLALLAILFSFVGNRGLIRNSIHFARYEAPPVPPGLRLEFDLQATNPSTAQLFWDTGNGFNETQSARVSYEPHPGLQTLRYDLPSNAPLTALRFDPLDGEGELRIRGIRVVDAGHRTRAVLPIDALQPVQQIAEASVADEEILHLRTAPASGDPITVFKPEALTAINEAISR